MRSVPPAPIRRALAAVLSLTACGVALVVSPASADFDETAADRTNTAVVSRLSVSDGHGWLTLHLRSRTAVGYDVRIPAGNGSWSGKPDVFLPEQDAHCVLQPGPDLHYVCRPSAQPEVSVVEFPPGGFSVSIPVTRTGSVDGLTGSAHALGRLQDGFVDTFPVLDGSHYRSTAEVRLGAVHWQWGGAVQEAGFTVTTTIVPRETITALDVSLPPGGWRISGSNAERLGVRCFLVAGTGSSTSMHCRPSSSSTPGLPVGRYNLAFDLTFVGSASGSDSQVSLTAAGISSAVQDTFAWNTSYS